MIWIKYLKLKLIFLLYQVTSLVDQNIANQIAENNSYVSNNLQFYKFLGTATFFDYGNKILEYHYQPSNHSRIKLYYFKLTNF